MSTEAIIDRIIAAEGGYVDDPADSGGCTNMGITIETLRQWRNMVVDCEDVRQLTEDEARAIYRNRYIEDPKLDEIRDPKVRELLVDSAVQHGPGKAVEWLQAATGTTVDGIIGPVTLEAVSHSHPRFLHDAILAQRIRYYGAIISNDPSQARFAEGWMNRVTGFLEEAKAG